MSKDRPKKIRVMADFAYAYCWNMKNGCAILLDDFYDDAPEVVAIVKELEKWQEWFERDCYDSHGAVTLPFEAFNEKGIELAKKLSAALKPIGVDVYYQGPSENLQKHTATR